MQFAAAPVTPSPARRVASALLAIFLRFAAWRAQALDSLSVNAYSMYLLHYVFVVWLQYALLDIALFAIGKAAIVFGGTLVAELGCRHRRRRWATRSIRPGDVNARCRVRARP